MKIKISENSKLTNHYNIPFLSALDGNEIHVNPRGVSYIYDAWFIFGDLPKSIEITKMNSNNIFFFECETAYHDNFYNKIYVKRFYRQFKKIFGFSKFVSDSEKEPPYLPWMLDFNHGTSAFKTKYSLDVLKQINFEHKKKKFSVICSDKALTQMQKQRLEFVKALKIKLGDRLDWFGSGINPIDMKIDGLRDYEFSLCIENVQQNNVFSEKLIDPILTNTVPIYIGAPNIGDFFDDFSIPQVSDLSIDKVDEIIKIVGERRYEELTASLRKNKDRCLNERNWLKRAISKLDLHRENPSGKTVYHTLTSIRANKILTAGL